MDQAIEQTRAKLNLVGKGFCLAKWLQVTVHLQLGHTHSCHHPASHLVPISELKNNPSALHNSKFKKNIRQEMLDGKRPVECDYCWKIEDISKNQLSDRHLKSHDHWAAPYFEDVLRAGANTDINPTYLEVSFSNKCNFKCAYCNPAVSSKWMSEAQQFGPYPTNFPFNSVEMHQWQGKMPIEDEDQNPYVEKFWEWMPSLHKDLKVFRVTGGEPLLAKSTFKLLEFFEKNPNREMEFAVNTNLGIPFEIAADFTKRLNRLIESNSIRSAHVYTSLDTFGKQAEIIRYGLNLELFQKNLKHLLENSRNLTVTFMVTFNIFSFPQFPQLVEFVRNLKRDESQRGRGNMVFLDIAYLRHPQFLSSKLAPKEMSKTFLKRAQEIMHEHSHQKLGLNEGFHDFELIKVDRLIDYLKENYDAKEYDWMKVDLWAFVCEYEKRRKVDFAMDFPEYQDFLKEIRRKYEVWHAENPGKVWAGGFLSRPRN